MPLFGDAAPLTPDAPHDARAYELYLRANELARTYDGLPRAREAVPAAAWSSIRASLPRGLTSADATA